MNNNDEAVDDDAIMDNQVPAIIEEEAEVNEEDENSLLKVNLSAQGLTVVPATLFSTTDITMLDLSSNNIRSLPTEFAKLTNLVELNLSRNGIRCTNAKDFTSIPIEMKQLTELRVLNISECNLSFLPATIWLFLNLESLNISRNKINVLPPEIGTLTQLEWLNAQQTGLKKLPVEISYCTNLRTLLLYGNPIEELPITLVNLNYLEILSFNSVYLASRAELDENMLEMMKRGQLQSEHIPALLFEIPSLSSLQLDNCQMNNLPELACNKLMRLSLNNNYFQQIPSGLLSNLQELYLNDNQITQITDEIGQLKSLRILEMRSNQLISFSSKLFTLPSLLEVDFDHNKIQIISVDDRQCPSNTQTQHNLRPENVEGETVDCASSPIRILRLSGNQIETLPDQLVLVAPKLETLDLSKNRIGLLPKCVHRWRYMNSVHTYHGLIRTGLWLHGNPLQFPHPDIWKTTDLTQIWTYLKKQELFEVEKILTTRIALLGNSHCGKTSFLKSFTQRKAMTNNVECATTPETVDAFEMTKWTSSNNVKFLFLDLSSHRVYRPMLLNFLRPNVLINLVIDVEAYASQGFAQTIGQWLIMLAKFVPSCPIILVLTKCDLLSSYSEGKEEENKENDDFAEEKSVTVRLNNIKRQILEELADFLGKIETKLKQRLHVLKEIFVFSCVNEAILFESARRLEEQLEMIGIDRQRFPDINADFHAMMMRNDKLHQMLMLIKSPDFLYEAADDSGEEPKLFVELNRIFEVASEQFGLKNQELITSYLDLHFQNGAIVWFRHSPHIGHIIFPNVQQLLGNLRLLARICSLSTAMEQQSELDESTPVIPTKLDFQQNHRHLHFEGNIGSEEEMRVLANNFMEAGHVSVRLCKSLLPRNSQKRIHRVCQLINLLDMAWINRLPRIPTSHSISLPMLTVHALNRRSRTSDLTKNAMEVAAVKMLTDDQVGMDDLELNKNWDWKCEHHIEAQFNFGVPWGLWDTISSRFSDIVMHREDRSGQMFGWNLLRGREDVKATDFKSEVQLITVEVSEEDPEYITSAHHITMKQFVGYTCKDLTNLKNVQNADMHEIVQTEKADASIWLKNIIGKYLKTAANDNFSVNVK